MYFVSLLFTSVLLIPGHSALPNESRLSRREPLGANITNWVPDTHDPPYGDPIPNANIRNQLALTAFFVVNSIERRLNIYFQEADIGPEEMGLGIGIEGIKRARVNVVYEAIHGQDAYPLDLRIAHQYLEKDNESDEPILTIDHAFEFMIRKGKTGGRFVARGSDGSFWSLQFMTEWLPPDDHRPLKIKNMALERVPLPAAPTPPET